MRTNPLSVYTRRLCTVLAVIAAGWLAAGCSQSLLIELEQIAASSQKAAINPVPENRLLVQGLDGNLYTMKPDGSEKYYLTTDASSRRQYLQPTWSPSAEQIAWSKVEADGETLASYLIVSRYDGAIENEINTPFPPFYYSWSPNGEHLAYLSNWVSVSQSSIALRLLDVSDPESGVSTLAEGQPLYFSWSPDSSALLLHIGNERIESLSLDGVQTSIELTAAHFPAPLWSLSTNHLLYARTKNGSQELVMSAADGSSPTVITEFDGRISFTLNASGEQLAYTITPASIGTAALGPLYVVELESQRTRQLSDSPVIAYFWSPDGEKLAYLAVEEYDANLTLRWYVWDGASRQQYDQIVPSQTFLSRYVAFFDQYAQSMTIWSPDSTAFTYAGAGSSGRRGIWVQALDEQAEPHWVGRGVFAAWSPR